MKPRVFVLPLSVLLLSCGVSVAQPCPLSGSPDEARLIGAYPALADARALGGGIVITGVDQFGCNSGQLKLGLAAVIADPTQTYVLRTVLRDGNIVRVNDRVDFTFPSGIYQMTILNSTTGGYVHGGLPQPANTPFVVEMLFTETDGTPLWFATIAIDDCDGSPSTTSGNFSEAVRVLNKNPTLQPDAANPALAAKWKPSGKVAYSCAGSGVCTETLKGKAGKITKLSQKAKLKPVLDAGARVGAVIIADTSGLVTGAANLRVNPRDSAGNPLPGYEFAIYNDSPLFPSSEVVHMPVAFTLSGDARFIAAELLLEDLFLGGVANGKLKVRAIYIYSVTP